MAELTTLARPYAKAAFEYAQAHQQLAAWSAMLGLAAAVSQDDTMQRVLKAPRLTSAEKANAFIEVVGDKFDAQAQNFIHIVSENGRLVLLPEIAEQFELFHHLLERRRLAVEGVRIRRRHPCAHLVEVQVPALARDREVGVPRRHCSAPSQGRWPRAVLVVFFPVLAVAGEPDRAFPVLLLLPGTHTGARAAHRRRH